MKTRPIRTGDIFKFYETAVPEQALGLTVDDKHAVCVTRTDEGVVVDVWQLPYSDEDQADEADATCYSFDKEPVTTLTCKHCGSGDYISRDAAACWNPGTGEWELGTLYEEEVSCGNPDCDASSRAGGMSWDDIEEVDP